MNFAEWLEQEVDHAESSYSSRRKTKRKERIAFLVLANGGTFAVRGWGFISSSKYGRQGLEQDEALELIFYSGVFEGAEIAQEGITKVFAEYWKGYVSEIESRFNENPNL